jgi:hypothetical protein
MHILPDESRRRPDPRSPRGLNTITLIAAIVSFTTAAVSFALIREPEVGAAEEGEEQAEPAVAA